MDYKKLFLIPVLGFTILSSCTNHVKDQPATDPTVSILLHPIPTDPMERAKQFREDIWQGYLALKPYNNGNTYQTYMTPIVNRYIPEGSDFKQAELLLRDAGFKVESDTISSNTISGTINDIDTPSLFPTNMTISIVAQNNTYQKIKKATILVWSPSL